jgi:hypothetical protein
MWRVWRKWTIQHHTFTSVKLSEAEARTLTDGLLSTVEQDDDGSVTLPTITYTFPPVAKKVRTQARGRGFLCCVPNATYSRHAFVRAQNLSIKPLNNDQKAQNVIFIKQCTRHWRDAQRQMRVELGQYLTDADARIRATKQKQQKNGAPAGRLPSREQLQNAGLFAIGLKRLHRWTEEDDEKLKEEARKQKAGNMAEGKQAHDGYVRDKDRKRIRLPTQVAGSERPRRFDFSVGKGLSRNCKTSVVSSTVELMRNSGLRYVHALSMGKQGMEGDLETCRRQLIKEGFVHKENFEMKDPDATFNDDMFRELRDKSKSAELTKRERQHDAEQAYSSWIQHKQWQELALQCLEAIDMPADVEKSRYAHWKKVGRALKAVDSSLLREWINWSKGLESVTPKVCSVLWDKFPPVGCDVHRGTSSPVRDVLLKILRPGIDYAAAFERLCDRKMRRQAADAEERGEGPMKREEMEETLIVSRKDMQGVFKDAGILLQPDEAR